MELQPVIEPSTHPIYSRLPLPKPRSIRLLNLIPGDDEDIIEVKLEVVDLD
jgi:hypothetical protein